MNSYFDKMKQKKQQQSRPAKKAPEKVRGVVVNISPWEYEWASFVGIRRATSNWGRHDSPAYDNNNDLDPERVAGMATCLCELAVAKHLNQYWPGGIWKWDTPIAQKHRHFADVGHDIEVRRVKTMIGPSVKPKDKGKIVWAARVLGREWKSVEVLGWIRADDVIDQSRDVVVPISKLNKPQM